jgi:hypothetical protein
MVDLIWTYEYNFFSNVVYQKLCSLTITVGQIEYGSGYKKLEYVPVSKDLISKKSDRLETLENM